MNEAPNNRKTAVKWLKRFGAAGFLFFLIKGLLWLALIVAATFFGYDFLS